MLVGVTELSESECGWVNRGSYYGVCSDQYHTMCMLCALIHHGMMLHLIYEHVLAHAQTNKHTHTDTHTHTHTHTYFSTMFPRAPLQLLSQLATVEANDDDQPLLPIQIVNCGVVETAKV